MDREAQEVVERGMDMLEAVANKLNVTIEYLWPYLVRQQIVEPIVDLILLAMAICGVVVFFKWVPNSGDGFEANPKYSTIGIIMVTIFGIIGFFAMGEFVCDLSGLLNPQYGALKDLMEMVR